MLMKYGGMMFRDLFLEKLYNLLRFCVDFSTNFAKHALSEMILLRGELGRITFDVGSRVQDYMRTLPPSIYEKQHNLVHLCYAPYTR